MNFFSHPFIQNGGECYGCHDCSYGAQGADTTGCANTQLGCPSVNAVWSLVAATPAPASAPANSGGGAPAATAVVATAASSPPPPAISPPPPALAAAPTWTYQGAFVVRF